jgi:HEPN domain-containing protein
MIVTSRAEFEKLIVLRLKEAKHLLEKKDWDGAYYLAGYAVEFALKIRIISQLMNSNAFPDKKVVDIYYRHDLTLLRKAAELDEEMDQDSAVKSHWEIVKDWSEQSRYELGATKQEAMELYDAIKNGVLPWIKARW